MFEWVNPWISGGISIFLFFTTVVLFIYEMRKDKGPVEEYVFTRNNGDAVIIEIQPVGDKIEVVQINSINRVGG